MAWRNANASVSLVNAVNARWPGRSKASDGTIGDAAHASRSSDHNPWVKVGGVGVVRARDITGAGIDPSWLAEQLRLAGRAGDSRLTGGGYVIYNHRITTPDFSGWKRYTGSNPHTKHVHVSFSQNRAGFDRTDGWAFLGGGPVSAGGAVGSAKPAANADVKWIQDRLNYWGFNAGTADGINGPKTKAAVVAFQKAKGLGADGIVGPKTRAALSANKPAAAPTRQPTEVARATQRAVRVGVDGFWGPGTDAAVNRVRSALNGQFPAGVAATQKTIGASADGKWGPKSKAALGNTVKSLQRAWGTGADGGWGPKTEAAWTRARNANYRP